MAVCQSLVALPLQCAADGVIGGASEVYAIAVKDLGTVTGSVLPYAISPTTGAITEIALKVATVGFVKIGQLKNTAGVSSEYTKNANGTSYSTSTVTIQLTELSVENQKFVDSVKGQPVAFMIKSRAGKFYGTGLEGGMELATQTSGTGIQESDLIGYALTFVGVSGNGERFIETSAALAAIKP